jgi:hypothetical protein
MAVSPHIVDFKSAQPPALFSPRKETQHTLYTRGWVGLGADQNRCGKCLPYRNSILDRPARSQSLHHFDLVTCLLTPCLSAKMTPCYNNCDRNFGDRLDLHSAKSAACSTKFKLDIYRGCSVFIGTPTVIHYVGAGDVTIKWRFLQTIKQIVNFL